ncbi:MAG TPA: hypothetical protein VIG69_13025, partial [Candidatus Methylomirabilis sp.]
MRVYTFSQARQQLASLLNQAAREGQVRIRRRDGQMFSLQPVRRARSPLDVPAVATDITTDEIVRFVRESRRSWGVAPRRARTQEAG